MLKIQNRKINEHTTERDTQKNGIDFDKSDRNIIFLRHCANTCVCLAIIQSLAVSVVHTNELWNISFGLQIKGGIRDDFIKIHSRPKFHTIIHVCCCVCKCVCKWCIRWSHNQYIFQKALLLAFLVTVSCEHVSHSYASHIIWLVWNLSLSTSSRVR